MKEIWADVHGYNGKYQVSTWGRVRNERGIMAQYHTEKGYMKVDLCRDGRRTKNRVHRLVAETFIPNYENLPEINHVDGNKENNSVTNLEWVSGKMNRDHEKVFLAGIYSNIQICEEMSEEDESDAVL